MTRGIRWQYRQKWLDLFMNASRSMGRPHRGHARPTRP